MSKGRKRGNGHEAAAPDASAHMAHYVSGWTEEMQREFAMMVEHYSAARDRLLKCRSVFDVIKVEQDFVAARSKAYFDAGLRMANLFSTATQDLAKETAAMMATPIAPMEAPHGDGPVVDIH
jgi:hypothetical protein